MRKISLTKTSQGLLIKEYIHEEWHSNDGINFDFIFENNFPEREYLNIITSFTGQFDWLECENNQYFFKLEEVRRSFPSIVGECEWMKGKILLKPEIIKLEERTIVNFSATKEEINLNYPMKIFLSHKGADKPLVREYHKLLLELGFEPWLDEDAMSAGTSLDRALLQGFEESCAVIFFITPNYVDDGYLATEIDYAIQEQRTRQEKFTIITLMLPDEEGKRGIIPSLLRRFVWKEPENSLEAFKEIIKALPIKLGNQTWK